MTVDTANRVARSRTRTRPCSLDEAGDVVLAFAGEDVAGRGAGRDGQTSVSQLGPGSRGRRGFGSVSTHLVPKRSAMSRNQIEINRNLWHAVAMAPVRQPGQTHRPGPAATTSAPPTSSPVRSKSDGIDSPYHRRGGPLDRRRRATEAHVTSESTHPRRTGRAPHRAAVVGVRQLRDAVQGVRPAGRPARPVREDRRRRRRSTATPASRRRSRCTSRGTRSTTTRSSPPRRRTAASPSGTINSNTFQDDDYMLGSVCHPDPRVRQKAIDHLLECVDIMDATGSRDLKLWFADGTNYPGQDDIRARQDRLAEALADRLRAAGRRTSGWCSSTSCSSRRSTRPTCPTGARRFVHCVRARAAGAGRRRHRPPRAGHEHRVHRRVAAAGRQARRVRLQLALLRRRRPDGRRGRPVPAVPDHARGREGRTRCGPRPGVAFMLDQCHNIEPKIPGQIRSVMNVQEATAKALLVDRRGARRGPARRRRARRERRPDGRLRHRRPAAARRAARAGMGLDPDPMAAYARSGLRRADRRRAGRRPGQAGWGA